MIPRLLRHALGHSLPRGQGWSVVS